MSTTTRLSPAMQESSGKSTTPVSDVVSVYIRLIKWVLAAAAIKYQGLTTNPFQEQSAGVLIFLIAIFCHAIAPTAAKPSRLTVILFHSSGIIAFEAVLWVLVTKLLWFIIIDVFILLVALMYYHKDICKLPSICYQNIFGQEGLNNADQKAGSEAEGGIAIGVQVTEIKRELGNSSV